MRGLTAVTCAFAVLVVGAAGADDLREAAQRQGAGLATGSHAAWQMELRDYPSARFRNVHPYFMHPDPARGLPAYWYLCGEVNAKTGAGGYTGWDHFVVVPTEAGLAVILNGTGPYDFATNIKMQIANCTDAMPQFAHTEYADRDFSAAMAYGAR